MADVTVNINDNGPYEILGPIQLKDADGNEFSVEGDQYLCRCGNSGDQAVLRRVSQAGWIPGPSPGGVTRRCPAPSTPLEEYLCQT